MAYPNKIISNPKTGQTIKFLKTASDTGGQFLEMESTLKPGSEEPPLHYHPFQEENFSIISGDLTVKLNGELKTYSVGDHFHVPKNTHHSMWNQSSQPVTIRWKISPALNTETFFENTIGLANDGKTNQKGMPNILQVALIANRYNHIFRLAKPPFVIQRIVFGILTPFAYLAGYRSSYDKYLQ